MRPFLLQRHRQQETTNRYPPFQPYRMESNLFQQSRWKDRNSTMIDTSTVNIKLQICQLLNYTSMYNPTCKPGLQLFALCKKYMHLCVNCLVHIYIYIYISSVYKIPQLVLLYSNIVYINLLYLIKCRNNRSKYIQTYVT